MTALCKNCKFFTNPNGIVSLEHGKCRLFPTIIPAQVDLVSGKVKPEYAVYLYASDQRNRNCIDASLYKFEADPFKRFLNQRSGSIVYLFAFMIGWCGMYFLGECIRRGYI